MPSTTQELRDKFMKDGDDGIGKAEKLIQEHGGLISENPIGYIDVPPVINIAPPELYPDFWDAVQFLCEEWDYAVL